MKKRGWILILLLLTGACAGTTQGNPQGPQGLSLTPKSFGGTLSLSQLVTGDFDGRTYRMRFEIDITPDRLAVVALSPLGVTLFTLVQEQDKPALVTRGQQPIAFDPSHILFDLHLTYWPRKALHAALSQLSLTLFESDDGSVRRVQDPNGKTVTEITYGPKAVTPRSIVIQHFDVPYRLRIRSRDVGPRKQGKGKPF
ncbi:MAG: DUF3261 domain-containing protein [Rhodospirillaceae bacterium]|jgi:hypothetical protein|nr:DUF3261 domain-containing protein [Rhodospirillaceae bacterium]